MLDLISAGFVDVGTQLEPRSSTYRGRYCTVLSNGHLECDDGKVFETPSGAGKHVTGRPSVNGWWFWKFKGRDGLPARLREEYLLRFHLDGTIDDLDGSEFDDNDFEAESESSPE